MNRKQVIRDRCANYKDGLCVLRDIECPLVTAFEYRGHRFSCEEAICSFFENNVKGAQKEVVVATHYSYKPCKACGKPFKPTSRASLYCGELCRKLARKQSHMKYDSKRK